MNDSILGWWSKRIRAELRSGSNSTVILALRKIWKEHNRIFQSKRSEATGVE